MEVAARFEAKHLERAEVYAQKLEAAKAELALQRRNVSEMTTQFKAALKRRESLVVQARRAKATEGLRGGRHSSVDEFDRMEREILDSELEASAASDLQDALDGLDAADFESSLDPEDLAEAQLEELKRRMAKGEDL